MIASSNSDRRGLLAAGNFIVDHVKTIDVWPKQDALANIVGEVSANGGSPYNILINLTKLGAAFPLQAAGCVGADANGAFVREHCRSAGIAVGQLHELRDAATSYTDVMTVRSDGRRTFFHQRGANARFGREHVDFTVTRARHFHLGYMLLLDALDALDDAGKPGHADLLARARAAGLTTSVDCVSEESDRFASILLGTLPEVDLLFANDFEAEKLTGLRLGRGEEVEPEQFRRAAAELLRLGVRQVVVIHAPEGVCAVTKSGEARWQPSVALPGRMIAGAAGAGDALAAGVLYGWHEGWPLERALELGTCAAAASLTHASCSEGVRTVEESLRFGRELGFRGAGQRWSTGN
ncbi:carbohydrate kinase family protein [Horticoccus luteus]|uniref:Carbohydrate kinase family protein n=1 Tax=Horticoccus luteus TaxID=2862869 RepID=A0A8F9TX40_9BACT|nr:carbohydrate kinase family protein [Horticoccus luteus]QYM79647.1 carbohydrate kinase family protein [Horticoccus luteus]